MEIIETPIFTKRIDDYLTKEEYRNLQWALVINPLAGVLIPGAGGLRKLRWRISGKGKSGGLRIIYYYYNQAEQIYLLLPFRKSDCADLSKEQLKILSDYVKDGVL